MGDFSYSPHASASFSCGPSASRISASCRSVITAAWMFSKVRAASSFTYGARNRFANCSASSLSRVPVDLLTRFPLIRHRTVQIPVFSNWRPPSPLLRLRLVSFARTFRPPAGSEPPPAGSDSSPPAGSLFPPSSASELPPSEGEIIECVSPDCFIATVEPSPTGLAPQFTSCPSCSDWFTVTSSSSAYWFIVTDDDSGDWFIVTEPPFSAVSTRPSSNCSLLIVCPFA